MNEENMQGDSNTGNTQGSEVTLDDPKTAYDLFFDCWSELGRSLCYMDFFNPDIEWDPQRSRVAGMCRRLSRRRDTANTLENREYFSNFLEMIKNEVENQC